WPPATCPASCGTCRSARSRNSICRSDLSRLRRDKRSTPWCRRRLGQRARAPRRQARLPSPRVLSSDAALGCSSLNSLQGFYVLQLHPLEPQLALRRADLQTRVTGKCTRGDGSAKTSDVPPIVPKRLAACIEPALRARCARVT